MRTGGARVAVMFMGLLACAPRVTDDRCRLSFSDRGDARVFVVAHKVRVSDAESYASFERSIQRHADTIRPCLSARRPNLVAFGEDAGLVALLLGARGAAARAAPDSTTAFLAGAVAHLPGILEYQQRYAGISAARALLLSASDPVHRSMDQAFGGFARELGVYVVASGNVGVMDASSDARDVAFLRDPGVRLNEPAYVATGPEVHNAGIAWGPDGARVGRVNKVFLTDPEEQTLDLTNGSFAGMDVVALPFGRVGIAISRDAWYPPFMQRLEDLDVNLVLQLEAFFGGWTITQDRDDEWLPDVFLQSGWLHTQKYRTFRASLAPQLVGNFFELVMDGQPHIVQAARRSDVPRGYVGSALLPGFTGLGGWAMDDPRGVLTQSHRRHRLREHGRLLAGTGSRGSNAYAEGVVAADLDLDPANDAPTPVVPDPALPRSAPLAAAVDGMQRNVDLASDGRNRVVAAWQEGRPGAWRIRTARGNGTTWEPANDVEPMQAGLQRRPSVCMNRNGRTMITWQDGAPGSEVVRFVITGVNDSEFSAPASAPVTSGPQWEPDCGFLELGRPVLAWTDLSTGVPRVMAAVDVDRPGATAISVDSGGGELARLGGSQVQPSLSTEGGHLAWIDYRERSWDVRYARFGNGVFGPSTRVDGVTGTLERLHGEPQVHADGDRVVIAFTDLHDRRPHSDIGVVVSTDNGSTWGGLHLVPGGAGSLPVGFDHGGGGMPRFRPALAGEHVYFQDMSVGRNALMRGSLATETAAPVRVDDTADADVNLVRVRAASVVGGAVIAWEDDREGPYRVYWSRVPVGP